MQTSAGMITLDRSRLQGFREFFAAEAALQAIDEPESNGLKGSLRSWLEADDGSKKKFAMGVLVGISLSAGFYSHSAATMSVAPGVLRGLPGYSNWLVVEMEFLSRVQDDVNPALVEKLHGDATAALRRMLPPLLNDQERNDWADRLVNSTRE